MQPLPISYAITTSTEMNISILISDIQLTQTYKNYQHVLYEQKRKPDKHLADLLSRF